MSEGAGRQAQNCDRAMAPAVPFWASLGVARVVTLASVFWRSDGDPILLFDPDGHLMRIPEKLMTELAFGQNTLPQYAGRKIRVAEVYVDHEARKPKAITRAIGIVWHLDEKGSIKADVLDSVRDAMRTLGEATAPPESRAGKVVSIAGKIERKRFDEKHRWELDKDDLDRISATIWPPRGRRRRYPSRRSSPPPR